MAEDKKPHLTLDKTGWFAEFCPECGSTELSHESWHGPASTQSFCLECGTSVRIELHHREDIPDIVYKVDSDRDNKMLPKLRQWKKRFGDPDYIDLTVKRK